MLNAMLDILQNLTKVPTLINRLANDPFSSPGPRAEADVTVAETTLLEKTSYTSTKQHLNCDFSLDGLFAD